ncbi:ABC transporter ATP-binding protein [Paenibacillus hamazuiensis]|uniref:ABC transporter ATP-binding protein n=1 Tax=Paenibacillus hamazuiensis TaxID=2936508 RepID=UPI00200D77E9|nr:ABC transporter ATP-binding protein [Paenibacillus hamazuiensis]
MPLLEVRDLSVVFTQYDKGLRQKKVQIIQGLDLSVDQGELVAVIGSSGSGKSLLAHAILGILPPNAAITGEIRYDGELLTEERRLMLRGKEIAFIPQSVTYLDPLMKVGAQVRASVRGSDAIREQRKQFERYRLAPEVEHYYPYQLSGGMARRVLVSTAAVGEAKLIVADEPTPGLNSEILNEALKQLREMADKGCAVLLITHDIDSVLPVCDKVAVFYAGTTLEIAPSADFKDDGNSLRHPYTKALWRALPENDFAPIAGSAPQPSSLPGGCLFAPRCGQVTPECLMDRPEMREVRGGMARCIHAS